MNRINQKLKEQEKLLSIYFTAGYPRLGDTVKIIEDLEKNGVDLIEIGLPFQIHWQMALPYRKVQQLPLKMECIPSYSLSN